MIHLFVPELCLTSNVKGQTVPSYDKHHFQYWYELQHPCVLCVSASSHLMATRADRFKITYLHHPLFSCFSTQTDDKGVFCTDLSQEYHVAASTFGLTQDAVWSLSQQAIQCSFAPEAVKQKLEQRWAELRPHVLH